MPADTKDQAPEKAKVVLVSIPEAKDQYEVVKVLASQLGITFEEADEIVGNMPSELLPSVPIEAGESFAEVLRNAGAEIEVLPIGPAAGRFCSTHPYRRARARCKDPGCDKYICEICIRGSGMRLFCPECYQRYRRRRVLIALGSLVGVFVLLGIWYSYSEAIIRTIRYLAPASTTKVAMVCVSRTMDQDTAGYYIRLNDLESPGKYQPEKIHMLPELDGWFQREFERLTDGEINILEVDVYGLYELPGEVPKPSRTKSLSYQAIKADRAFKKFIKELIDVSSLDLSAYDLIVLVELTPSVGVTEDAVEKMGMFADEYGYVKFPYQQAEGTDYYVMIAAHYLARMMGASLKLNQFDNPLFPFGFANPAAKDKYAQTAAELTGMYVPTSPTAFERIDSLDKVVVGGQTAYEMGWISGSMRNYMYEGISE